VIKSTACVVDALSKGTLDTLMEPVVFVPEARTRA
jgi:hypothetical protein